jgi:hypothetical protein
MAHAAAARPEVEPRLFKADRPRAIDQHINYFGGASEPQGEVPEDDTCGETLLGRLA